MNELFRQIINYLDAISLSRLSQVSKKMNEELSAIARSEVEFFFGKLEQLVHVQENRVIDSLESIGLVRQEVSEKISCCYEAVALFLRQDPSCLRENVCCYIEQNPNQFEDYVLEQNVNLDCYISGVRKNGVWDKSYDGEFLMRALGRPIIVIKKEERAFNIENSKRFSGEPIFVCIDEGGHYDALLCDEKREARQIFTELVKNSTVNNTSLLLPNPKHVCDLYDSITGVSKGKFIKKFYDQSFSHRMMEAIKNDKYNEFMFLVGVVNCINDHIFSEIKKEEGSDIRRHEIGHSEIRPCIKDTTIELDKIEAISGESLYESLYFKISFYTLFFKNVRLVGYSERLIQKGEMEMWDETYLEELDFDQDMKQSIEQCREEWLSGLSMEEKFDLGLDCPSPDTAGEYEGKYMISDLNNLRWELLEARNSIKILERENKRLKEKEEILKEKVRLLEARCFQCEEKKLSLENDHSQPEKINIKKRRLSGSESGEATRSLESKVEDIVQCPSVVTHNSPFFLIFDYDSRLTKESANVEGEFSDVQSTFAKRF